MLSQRALAQVASSWHQALQRSQELATAVQVAGQQRVQREASTMAGRARKTAMCWKTRLTLLLHLMQLLAAQHGPSVPACEVLLRRLLQLSVRLRFQGRLMHPVPTAAHRFVADVAAIVPALHRRCCIHFLPGICKRSQLMRAVEAQAATAAAAQYPLAQLLAAGEPVQASAVVLLLMAGHTLMGMHPALLVVVASTCVLPQFLWSLRWRAMTATTMMLMATATAAAAVIMMMKTQPSTLQRMTRCLHRLMDSPAVAPAALLQHRFRRAVLAVDDTTAIMMVITTVASTKLSTTTMRAVSRPAQLRTIITALHMRATTLRTQLRATTLRTQLAIFLACRLLLCCSLPPLASTQAMQRSSKTMAIVMMTMAAMLVVTQVLVRGPAAVALWLQVNLPSRQRLSARFPQPLVAMLSPTLMPTLMLTTAFSLTSQAHRPCGCPRRRWAKASCACLHSRWSMYQQRSLQMMQPQLRPCRQTPRCPVRQLRLLRHHCDRRRHLRHRTLNRPLGLRHWQPRLVMDMARPLGTATATATSDACAGSAGKSSVVAPQAQSIWG